MTSGLPCLLCLLRLVQYFEMYEREKNQGFSGM